MKKKDLIQEISKNTGVEQVVVNAVLSHFTHLVMQKLSDDETVVLRGFGTFLVKKRAARVARNLQKNKMMRIPARKIPFFRPSKDFSLSLASNLVQKNDVNLAE